MLGSGRAWGQICKEAFIIALFVIVPFLVYRLRLLLQLLRLLGWTRVLIEEAWGVACGGRRTL